MSERQSPPKLSGEISQEDIREIIRHLGVENSVRAGALEKYLIRLCRDVWKTEHLIIVGRGRRDQLEWLEDLHKHLARIDDHLRSADPLTRKTIGRALAPTLARVLGRNGMIEVYPETSQFLSNDGHDARDPEHFRATSNRASRYRDSDRFSDGDRRFAQDHSAQLIHGLLRALDEPIAIVLENERSSPRAKGGPPRNHLRELVIRRAAEIFEYATGNIPTTTPNGPFETLCSSIMEVLGIDEKGLNSAIKRTLSG